MRSFTAELSIPICDVPKYNSDQFLKEFNIKNSATLIRNKPWFNTDVQKKCFEF